MIVRPSRRKGPEPIPPPQVPPAWPERPIFKRKYEPDFPIVAIAAAQPGLIVTGSQLEALGLVALPEPVKAPAANQNCRACGRWPRYEFCLARAPMAHGGENVDTSRADFAWCITALDWGWSVEDVAARLMEESAKAQENGSQYALLTATNAASALRH